MSAESKYINIDHRYKKEEIWNLFPELKYNPFSDRIFKVFSTQDDRTLSFDEFMNLCSVFSEHSPLSVKSAWAFLIFDFDEDNQITENDLNEMVDRLTQPMLLSDQEKSSICDVVRNCFYFLNSFINFYIPSFLRKWIFKRMAV